jgi:hypothetical protein
MLVLLALSKPKAAGQSAGFQDQGILVALHYKGKTGKDSRRTAIQLEVDPRTEVYFYCQSSIIDDGAS